MLSKSVDGADLINLWERTWSTFSPVLSRLKWRLWYLGFHILFPVLCSFSGGHHEIYLCTIACIDARKLNSAFLVLTPMEFSIAPPPPPPNYLANPLLGLLNLNPSSTNMFWQIFASGTSNIAFWAASTFSPLQSWSSCRCWSYATSQTPTLRYLSSG